MYLASAEPARAERCYTDALEVARALDDSWDEAHALAGLARCALAAGQVAEASAGLRHALEIFRRIGSAEAAEVSAELDALSKQNRATASPRPQATDAPGLSL